MPRRNAFLAAMLAASPTLAQAEQAKDIETIAAWVKSVGHSAAPLREDVAKAMGLGTGLNSAPFCVSYGDAAGALDYVFCVFPGRAECMTMRTGSQFTLFWLVKDGDIVKTILTDPKRLLVLPNKQYRAAWIALKDAFLAEAKGTASKAPKQ
jgi:hypothetical protein